jgi:dihydrodipicolinate synthase/N-acetylneuraminate lyase
LSRLSERQIDSGTAALIVCGSTGEAAAVMLPDYARAVRTVAEDVGTQDAAERMAERLAAAGSAAREQGQVRRCHAP